MGQMRQLFFGLLVLVFTSPAGAEPFEFGARFANLYIVGGYERAQSEAELQRWTMQQLCAVPSEENYGRVTEQFRHLVAAYSQVEFVKFGPVLVDNRSDRLMFFPDRRGIGLRQIQGLLADEDEAWLEPGALTQKSVALQGLLALEYVMFGSGAEILTTMPESYRCRYGVAIAAQMSAILSDVVSDWTAVDGIGSHMASPDPAHSDYRDNDEVLREFISVFVHGVEWMRDVRLAPLAGETIAENATRTALLRRSDLSTFALAENAKGLRTLLSLTRIEDLLPDERRWIVGSIDFELQNFINTANSIADMSLEDIVADDEARSKLRYLHIVSRSLQRLVVTQLAAELGLAAGFSALDGD